jgi:transcriptional regulator with XRE-family HTH domain
MTLGEKITLLRKKNNLSQPDVALKVGVTRDTIGKYERNDIIPTVEKAKKIADTFGVTLDFLMSTDLEEPKNIMDKEMSSRIQELNRLTDSDRDKILSIVDAFIRDAKTKNAYRAV